MNQSSNVLHGIKFTPFRPDVPIEALHTTPAIDFFVRRVELGIADGGFVSVTGEPGSGKSFALRLLADRLRRLPNVVVGMIEHPQSRTSDFYRELGDLFGIPLQVHNRWAGFKALRQRWSEHIAQTLMRPVLIIDEAQEAQTAVLNEIRILASKELDSRHAVILFEHPTIDEHHLDDPPSLVAARRVLGASRALRRELRRHHVAVLDALGSPDDELPF